MLKNILAGIGILAIIIFLALLAGVFFVLPKFLKAEPFTIKPDVVYSYEGIQLSITVNEGDINAKIAEMPEIAERIGQVINMKTRNLRVKLEKDRLTAALDADIWGDGTWVTGSMTAKVFVAQGKPAVELERITMGVMPLPPSLVSQFSVEANKRLAAMDLKLPMDLKEIRIEEGKITVTGTLDARKLRFEGGRLRLEGIN